MEIKIEKLKNSEVEITGSIPFEKLEEYKGQAIKNVSENITIAGFRKGHIPEKVLIEKVGEMTILNEMAELALQKTYPKIITENKIEAITSPQVNITKLASGNPLEFKIKIAVMPEFEIADYKEIAKKEMAKKEDLIEVTDKEVEDTIKQILASQKQPHSCSDEKCEHNNETEEQKSGETEEQKNEEKLTDEMVKKLGDFKDVEDFKVKLKENIKHEKEHRSKEAKKIEMIEKIAESSKIELPEILVDAELRKMIAEMSDNISRMGLKFDKYLEHIKKTEEDLKKEWRTDAEKRVKIQLVLNKISKEEKIEPKEEEVKKMTETLMAQYKNARKENVEIYVKMILSNEAVFKLLENQK
ncbi:hypothetical protein L6261_02575 [Candidatus Parcubacteria bacterium]|nr:hypothetical protein [Candidatus Parcubacteria bacterium]